MKKVLAGVLTVTALSMALSGCSEAKSVGSAAPGITAKRTSYFAAKSGNVKSKDITSVIAFMDSLKAAVGTNELDNYSTSYDADANTVYVTTDKANIAFRLDDNGDVLFASANGSPETKATLNKSIAAVYLSGGNTNQVQSIWRQAQETQWLNQINANVVKKAVSGTQMEALDTSLTAYELPEMTSMQQSDLERGLYGTGLEMPVLTDTLEEYGVTDLSNYYESIDMSQFYNGKTSDIQSEIDALNNSGHSLRDSFSNLSLEQPGSDVPEWTLSSYKLPSSFSDGTSTGSLGEATTKAFNSFNSALQKWQDELWAKEEAAQDEEGSKIQQSNTSGNATVLNKISQNTSLINSTQKNNLAAVNNKNAAASNTLKNFASSMGDIQSLYKKNLQTSANQHQQALANNQSVANKAQAKVDTLSKNGQSIAPSIANANKTVYSDYNSTSEGVADSKKTGLDKLRDSVYDPSQTRDERLEKLDKGKETAPSSSAVGSDMSNREHQMQADNPTFYNYYKSGGTPYGAMQQQQYQNWLNEWQSK